jgi:hypothetical protein
LPASGWPETGGTGGGGVGAGAGVLGVGFRAGVERAAGNEGRDDDVLGAELALGALELGGLDEAGALVTAEAADAGAAELARTVAETLAEPAGVGFTLACFVDAEQAARVSRVPSAIGRQARRAPSVRRGIPPC